MGSPKPLLPWGPSTPARAGLRTGEETLIEYDIRQLREAGVDDVVVVLGHRAAEIAPIAESAGARVVYNVRYRDGRATSLVAGASAMPSCDAIVVASVDQPRPAAVVRRLLAEHAGPVTVPAYRGVRGHPVVLDGALLSELRAATDETQGLRAVVEREGRAVREVEFETAVVLLDLNTREDYDRAVSTYFGEVKR